MVDTRENSIDDDVRIPRVQALLNGEKAPVTIRDILGVIVGVQSLLLALVAGEAVGFNLPLLRPILAVPLLAIAPGILLLLLADIRAISSPQTLLYAIGISLVVEMAIGVSISYVYALIGIARPISELPIVLTFSLIIIFLIYSIEVTGDDGHTLGEFSLPTPSPSTLLASTLPFIGIIAITGLNRYGATIGVVGYLIVLSLVPLLTVKSEIDTRLYPLIIWMSAVGLLYFKSLWDGSYPLEMWMHEMVLEQGRWVPILGGDINALPDIRGMGQEGVLTDAVLYPIYALVAGIETITQLEVVNPLFVALIPLAMYETFRRCVSEEGALLCVFIFIFNYRFYSQHYPNAPRDVMATLFIVLLLLLLTDSDIDQRLGRGLAVLFAVGVTVSHYGVTYLMVPALGLSLVALFGLHLMRRALNSLTEERYKIPFTEQPIIVNPLFITFAGVFILSWYLYTADGVKFQLLVSAVDSLSAATQTSGLASERVLSSKPFSIEMTRAMVAVILGLIGVGLLGETIRTLLDESTDVNNEHLVVAGSVATVFALTFTGLGTGFGQGRVLMLCLAVTGVFVIIGLRDLWTFGETIVSRNGLQNAVKAVLLRRPAGDQFHSVLVVFLCIFLLVNTGVVAETVTGGRDYGATTIVNNERLSQSDNPGHRLLSRGCIECDIQMRVWMLRHGPEGTTVYDGGLSKSHYWYGHSLVTQLDDFVTDYLLVNRSTLYWKSLPSNPASISNGTYVVLTHDNYDVDAMVVSGSELRPMNSTLNELGRSDRLYTSGSSTVYRVRNEST
jgi:uncharacterized membrane protein